MHVIFKISGLNTNLIDTFFLVFLSCRGDKKKMIKSAAPHKCTKWQLEIIQNSHMIEQNIGARLKTKHETLKHLTKVRRLSRDPFSFPSSSNLPV